jgi:anti-sigma regulatory factor (Ser/Thr protein kinase)
MTLDLHATPEEVMRAVAALQHLCESRKIPAQIQFGLALALEECASNIVNHALRRDAQQQFRVTLELTASTMTIELRDSGPPFDPTLPPAAQPTADAERPPGGWGIQLVRRYIDDMRYTRDEGVNILRLTKKLIDPPANALA